jgi:hypothetical protein
MAVRPRPAPPRLFGPDLLADVRSRLSRGYPTSPHSQGVRFELAKRDVNALLGEIMLRDQEIVQLHARIYELTTKPPA